MYNFIGMFRFFGLFMMYIGILYMNVILFEDFVFFGID